MIPDNLKFIMIFYFFLGLFLSPWSYGLFFLLFWIILCELIHYNSCINYNPRNRLAVLVFTIFGWFIGRTLLGLNDPFDNRVFVKKEKKIWHFQKN